MAFSAEPVRGDCLTHTIYIWPSRELVAGSPYWPESWHEAFGQATSQLASVVASYVLGGLPVTQQPITMELPVGCIRFSVRCRETSIYIAVSDFEGPEDPGPDAPRPNGGARRQASRADGLILGLRGTGKGFTVVTFYGPLPPIPAGYRLPSGAMKPRFQLCEAQDWRRGAWCGPELAGLDEVRDGALREAGWCRAGHADLPPIGMRSAPSGRNRADTSDIVLEPFRLLTDQPHRAPFSTL
jgi:hypothetical protein